MRKYLLTAATLITAFMTMNAQDEIFNNPDNEAYFGIRVGADITCPGNVTYENVGVDMFKSGPGIEFGAIYNMPVVANFYIEPGLKLYYDKYSYNNTALEALEDEFGVNIESCSIYKFGTRIPVMAGYHFDFTEDIKLSVFTGPELEIGFKADGKLKAMGKTITENEYDDGMSRVNCLWKFGAGVSIKKFNIEVSGGMGMVNMFKDSDAKFHENRVTLSLGYNF